MFIECFLIFSISVFVSSFSDSEWLQLHWICILIWSLHNQASIDPAIPCSAWKLSSLSLASDTPCQITLPWRCFFTLLGYDTLCWVVFLHKCPSHFSFWHPELGHSALHTPIPAGLFAYFAEPYALLTGFMIKLFKKERKRKGKQLIRF